MMAKKPKKKNPTVQVVIKCPGCKKRLIVSAYRKRSNPTVKAEYVVMTEVEIDKQKRLPLTSTKE
jgi:hypothetical protein